MTETPPNMTITQGEVRAFLQSRGYELPSACPKCSFEPWDESFVTPQAAVMTYAPHMPKTGRFQFICPNCGYLENFSTEPLINWKLSQT